MESIDERINGRNVDVKNKGIQKHIVPRLACLLVRFLRCVSDCIFETAPADTL